MGLPFMPLTSSHHLEAAVALWAFMKSLCLKTFSFLSHLEKNPHVQGLEDQVPI